MLDDETGEGVCVIDLDLVMPGLALYDFWRYGAHRDISALEDERDLSKVSCRMEMFEALTRGYLEGARLPQCRPSARSSCFRTVDYADDRYRFLTDICRATTLFRTHRRSHNLDRCRTVQNGEQHGRAGGGDGRDCTRGGMNEWRSIVANKTSIKSFWRCWRSSAFSFLAVAAEPNISVFANFVRRVSKERNISARSCGTAVCARGAWCRCGTLREGP